MEHYDDFEIATRIMLSQFILMWVKQCVQTRRRDMSEGVSERFMQHIEIYVLQCVHIHHLI